MNYIVRYRDSGSNDSFSIAMVGGDVENHKLKNLQASSGYVLIWRDVSIQTLSSLRFVCRLNIFAFKKKSL